MDSKTGEDSIVPVPIISENTSPANVCSPNDNGKKLEFKVKSFIMC
jgi:hypothetical protein